MAAHCARLHRAGTRRRAHSRAHRPRWLGLLPQLVGLPHCTAPKTPPLCRRACGRGAKCQTNRRFIEALTVKRAGGAAVHFEACLWFGESCTDAKARRFGTGRLPGASRTTQLPGGLKANAPCWAPLHSTADRGVWPQLVRDLFPLSSPASAEDEAGYIVSVRAWPMRGLCVAVLTAGRTALLRGGTQSFGCEPGSIHRCTRGSTASAARARTSRCS
jgi:hypothetical protein